MKQWEQSARRRPADARRRASAPVLPALLRRLRRLTRHGLIALGVLGAPGVVSAQVLVVTVREEPAAAAVSSAIVSATNTATGLRINALTNDAGRAAIRLSGPGNWIASVRRIGIAPASLPAVRVDSGITVAVVLTVKRARFALPSVLVAEAAVCGRAPLGANRIATLWEQVTLALQTTALTRDDSTRVSPFRAFLYERLLNPDMTVATSRVLSTGPVTTRPFSAVAPELLEKQGFVRRDSDGFFTFFAPDERVLLSESFLRTHCFSTPKRDANPALAELEFRPAPRRRVPDVAGVAYVDTTSGELRRLVFRYVNATRFIPPSARQSGGEVTFERLENGQWLVSEWVIRMPRLVTAFQAQGSPEVGYRESGGFLKSEAQAIADSVADAARRFAADSAARIAHDDGTARVVTRTDPSIRRIIRPDAFEDWPVFFASAKTVEARTRFAERRARADGTYLDSAAIAAIGAPTALGLLLAAPGLQPFVVPASLPAPSSDDDFALAEAWRPGVTLPMMALPTARSAAVPAADSTERMVNICFPKIYIDSRLLPLRLEELQSLRSEQLATMSIHAPNSAVALQARGSGLTTLRGNRCGVVQLQSYIDYP